MISLKSERELVMMRQAGKVVAEAIAEVERLVRPGVSTGELNARVESLMTHRGARPAFKGYHGYPASICTSVNHEIVHGIPGLKVLKEGDIISIDIGAEMNGYFADAAITLPVGEIDAVSRRLIETTAQALEAGIRQCTTDKRLSDISYAIQCVAETAGFSVVREYVGHGIGRAMHEDPQVPNYGRPGRGIKLSPGLVLAIEPMVNVGGYETNVLADNWTVVTKDGSRSAHFEHTVVITPRGPEILTRC
ncbi:MAG: type I methionyl aminopeptidase [Firmicutes bacterium]|nr:type I methionyl aminopeptidase [Dethiobacter sp.]MBS3888273.1 type I methionyl aminopeptidase [Bacillota bacterium]MBS4053633.1 type I methionyl aminopeptidase [Thermaerobacter sp.]